MGLMEYCKVTMKTEISIEKIIWHILVKSVNAVVSIANSLYLLRHSMFKKYRQNQRVAFFHLDNPFGPVFNIATALRIIRINPALTFTFVALKSPRKKNSSNIIENEKSYQSASQLISAFCNSHKIFASNVRIGISSDYRRNAKPENLIGDTIEGDKEVIASIIDQISYSRDISNKYDVFILPDVAYSFEHSLLQIARTLSKKFLIFNAGGHLLELSSKDTYPLNDLCPKDIGNLLRKSLVKQDSNLKNSFDELSAKAQVSESTFVKERLNILFLHCFRDASAYVPIMNDNYSATSAHRDDLLGWTEEMFRTISMDDKNWKIKIHPDSKTYQGETEIIKRLCLKYNLQEEIFFNIPTNDEILSEGHKCYTFSGTIALETASRGFKSICFADYFPTELVQYIEDYSELYEVINQEYSQSLNLEQQELAQSILKLYRPLGEAYEELLKVTPSRFSSFSSDSDRALKGTLSFAKFVFLLQKRSIRIQLCEDAELIARLISSEIPTNEALEVTFFRKNKFRKTKLQIEKGL